MFGIAGFTFLSLLHMGAPSLHGLMIARFLESLGGTTVLAVMAGTDNEALNKLKIFKKTHSKICFSYRFLTSLGRAS